MGDAQKKPAVGKPFVLSGGWFFLVSQVTMELYASSATAMLKSL